MPSLITREEALDLAALTAPQDVEALVERAWRVRTERFGDSTDICAGGSCSGGCERLVEPAHAAEAAGAHRFCLEGDLRELVNGAQLVAEHTDLKRCASVAALGRDEARRLRRAGIQRVHHAAPGVCRETLAAVRDAGLETCVGASIDLSAPAAQGVDLAFDLAAIEPTSVIVSLRDGGDAWQGAKWLAIFRLILPGTLLRLRGTLEPGAVRAGINGAMLGNHPATDVAMFVALGLNPARQPDNGTRPRPDNRSGWLMGETPDIVGEYLAQAAPDPAPIRIRLWDAPAPAEVHVRRLSPVPGEPGLEEAA